MKHHLPDLLIRRRACATVVFYWFVSILRVQAAELPNHVQREIRAAEALLSTAHSSVDAWPDALGKVLGKTLRVTKPINTAADFQAVLRVCPETFAPRHRFGGVFEYAGWFFASLDSTNEAVWIHGALVKKGTNEICFYSHW